MLRNCEIDREVATAEEKHVGSTNTGALLNKNEDKEQT